jgi:hypothetical protein
VSDKPVHRPSSDYPPVQASRNSLVPGLFIALLILLKIVYAFGIRIDPDETQHLHEITVPETYTLRQENGPVIAMLDGTPFSEPKFLAGTHELQTSDSSGPIALIWNRAIQKGFPEFVMIPDEGMRPED